MKNGSFYPVLRSSLITLPRSPCLSFSSRIFCHLSEVTARITRITPIGVSDLLAIHTYFKYLFDTSSKTGGFFFPRLTVSLGLLILRSYPESP